MSKTEKINNISDGKVKLKREKILWEIIAYAVPLALMAIVLITTGLYFETNDDIFISDILRGAITGAPEYHTIQNGVGLSWPLMILYKIIPHVAWYGLFLVLLKILSIALPLSAVYACDCDRRLKIIATVIAGLIFLSALYIQSNVQYTSTAMVAAFAGFICILLDDKKKNIIYFVLLEYLAYCTRSEAMEIVQPIGFALFIGVILSVVLANRDTGVRDKLVYLTKRIIVPIGISISIIVIGMMLYKVAYGSEGWKDCLSVFDARTVIFDYTGVPEAEEVSDILAEGGVSETEYKAYLSYFNYSWDDSNGVIEQIADYMVQNKSVELNPGKIIKWVLIDSYNETWWKLKIIMICAWGLCILAIIISRKFSGLIAVIAYTFSKILTWGFIYYKGRMPLRIMLPLYHIEILAALCIVFSILLLHKKSESKIDTIVGRIIVCATMGFGCLTAGTTILQYRYLYENVNGKEIMTHTYDEVSEYCNSYPERTFMISQYAYSYWMCNVYSARSLNNNWVYTGGWFGSMPGHTEYVDAYIDEEALFFVAPSSDAYFDQGKHTQIQYLEDKYNATLVMVDTIDLSTGGYYEVYEVVKN